MSSVYTNLCSSKTNLLVPLKDGLSVCSKYDPVKEAEMFSSQFSNDTLFFVIPGLCGGYHVKKLLEQNENRKIIVVEQSREDFKFLNQIDCCKELSKDPRVIFCPAENLFNTIINTYLPGVYSNLQFACLRGWENAFSDFLKVIRQTVDLALDSVRADYSVQARFGKIWQKNIFENLKLADGCKSQALFDELKKYTKKTAAIIAAGPSLDESISQLIQKREDYFIISTDTAYSTLLKSNITPDAVLSLDAQMISHAHFLHEKKLFSNTVFIMDLCSSPAISRKLIANGNKILFFESGHPLCILASRACSNSFIHLNAGAGTVTIACADLAAKLGFTKTQYFGADFAFLNGKPYAKGTYLETLYNKDSNCINSSEKTYLSLMYRRQLIKKNNRLTTEVLENYRKSFEYFLNTSKEEFKGELTAFDFDSFIKILKKEILSLKDSYLENLSQPSFFALLPLAAFYERSMSIQKSYELARSKTLRYT